MSYSYSHRNPWDRGLPERWDPRFQVNATCRFWWPSGAGESSFGLGRTTDLGIGGVSVVTSVLPPLGAPIMLEVDLPRLAAAVPEEASTSSDPLPFTEESVLLLTAEGTVLRHHRRGNGFAALIKQSSFAHQETRRSA